MSRFTCLRLDQRKSSGIHDIAFSALQRNGTTTAFVLDSRQATKHRVKLDVQIPLDNSGLRFLDPVS